MTENMELIYALDEDEAQEAELLDDFDSGFDEDEEDEDEDSVDLAPLYTQDETHVGEVVSV